MVTFGTISTGWAFGQGLESMMSAEYKCWLKITFTMEVFSHAHAPLAPPMKDTLLQIFDYTVKSECVCESGRQHGEVDEGDGINFGVAHGGRFSYYWSIWQGPKCGGMKCWPGGWIFYDPDTNDAYCLCSGGCGPFSLDDVDLRSGKSNKAMQETLRAEVKGQLAGRLKGTCITDEDCGGIYTPPPTSGGAGTTGTVGTGGG